MFVIGLRAIELVIHSSNWLKGTFEDPGPATSCLVRGFESKLGLQPNVQHIIC
jgi:hypothetical protein